jgi:hypothetical protein
LVCCSNHGVNSPWMPTNAKAYYCCSSHKSLEFFDVRFHLLRARGNHASRLNRQRTRIWISRQNHFSMGCAPSNMKGKSPFFSRRTFSPVNVESLMNLRTLT